MFRFDALDFQDMKIEAKSKFVEMIVQGLKAFIPSYTLFLPPLFVLFLFPDKK